jgi:hypothetical protein
MIKKIYTLSILMLTGSFLLLLQPAYAVEFQLQPRLETGVTLYSIELDTAAHTSMTMPDEATGSNRTQEKIEFSDTMSFMGCGTTLFINRLFVDLSIQYALEGNDSTRSAFSKYEEDMGDGSSVFESAELEYHGQFERKDLAVSVGYAVTEQLSLFVGYKWAETDLETTFDGPYSYLSIDQYVAYGRFSGKENIRFKYEGPFVGVAHGWQIERSSKYYGLISMNMGLAQLNSKLKNDVNGNIRIDSINGQEIEPIDIPSTSSNEYTGDTLGLALGLSWHGITPIKHLSYLVAISGHRYSFNSDDSDYSDTNETSVVCKVGLSYLF